MRWYIPIIVLLTACCYGTAISQELPPVSLPDSTLIVLGTADRIVPISELPVLPDMDFEIPEPDRLPEYDREHIEAMKRKLFEEMPRYPAVRLWDNQYAGPFIYTSRNRFSGLDMAGMGTRFQIAPWLSADVSAYLSGAYMGMDYRNPYMNATIATNVRIKLHDRIYLYGTGQISAREGMDSRYAPGFGGKNALGAGVEIWITDKVGIQIGRTWEFYQGSWYGHYNYGPMTRPGGKRR